MPDTTKTDQQAPYFKMYPRDFFASSHVRQMNSDEQGMYALLLFSQWQDGSIPADPKKIAKILHLDQAVFDERWLTVAECFVPLESDPSRLVNARLERERNDMIERSDSNKAAAEKRWSKSRKTHAKQEDADAMQAHTERNADAMQLVSHAEAEAEAEAEADTEADVKKDGERERGEKPEEIALEALTAEVEAVTQARAEADEIDAKAKAMLDHVGPQIKPLLATMTLTDWRKKNAQAARSLVLARVQPHEVVAFWARHRDREGKQLFMLSALQTSMQTASMPKSQIAITGRQATQGDIERGWAHGLPVAKPRLSGVLGFTNMRPKSVTVDEAVAWVHHGVIPQQFADLQVPA
jgi:uncharacterized protein YdaU (DUF1376 family)